MPFDFFDGFGFIGDLLSFLGSFPDSKSFNAKDKSKKKSKHIVEWWSGSLLMLSTILFFFVFKNPLPAENFEQTLIVCSLIGFVISFVMLFALYHLGLYYFKSLFKLLLFSLSVIILSVSIVLYIYDLNQIYFSIILDHVL